MPDGANQDQAAPTGLTGTAPSVYGGSDGKITGMTNAMEYKLDGAANYAPVSGDKIDNLTAGTYRVRYAAKAGYNPGSDTVVTVPDGNRNQSAPTGLAGTAPTASGGSDGKITGTTNAMEYKRDGVFCFGTNGEGYILSGEEKKLVLETVVEQVDGRVPVYAGTGCIGTKETIKQSQMAKDVGADVLSIITPSFAAASQNELYEHYATVAAAVDMPIVLYNIPARTGNALKPETVGKLSKNFKNIVGAKDSSGNFDNILLYIEQTSRENFSVLSGNDSLILWTLFAGGTGGIAGCANVYPKTMASIYDCFIAKDIEKAREYQNSIRSFRNCFKYGNPNTVVKIAVNLLGYNVGKCRAPFNQLPDEGIEALKKVLKENAQKGMC